MNANASSPLPLDAGARRRRVLLLAHRVPLPPDKGDKIRSGRWLRTLAARHDVYCACFVDNRNDWPWLPELRRLCAGVAAVPTTSPGRALRAAAALARGWIAGPARPLTTVVYPADAIARAVARWSRERPFDAVLAYSGAMAPVALHVPARRRVLDLCDCDSRKWLDYAAASPRLGVRRAIYHREAMALRAAEADWARRFDAVCVVNTREADLLAAAAGLRPYVVPNGVDLPAVTDIPRQPVVGFVGALDYRPNVDGLHWFVTRVWPRIRAAQAAAEFHVVGRSACRAVRSLLRSPGVRLIGAVPDVAPCIRRFRVSVAPLRIARGVQNKLLEAFAHRRAVVATTAVAAGTVAVPGRDLLVADDAPAFAEAVARLLRDDRLCESVAARGRRCAELHYDWTAPTAMMERLLFHAASLPAIAPALRLPAERIDASAAACV